MPPESENSQWRFAFALGAFALVGIFAVAICPVRRGTNAEDVPKFAAGVQVAGTKKYGSRDYVEYKFQHIIIPEIEFKETPLDEVLDELREASAANDPFETEPSYKGVNVFAKFDEIAPHTFEESVLLQEKAHTLAESLKDTKITLALENVSLEEAVQQIAKQAGVTFRVEHYDVALLTLARANEYRTQLTYREYRIPPTLVLPPIPPTAKTELGARDSSGIPRLIIVDTEEHLDQFGSALEDELEQNRIDTQATTSEPAPPPESPETKHINDKLSIVIPKVEFRETSLRDALAFLREKSVELDTTETDPERKGVNIVAENDFPGPLINPKITLSLRYVPLSMVLSHVAIQSGLKSEVNPWTDRVELASPWEWGDSFPTQEYKVPPEFLMDSNGRPQTARQFLESTGVIDFPPGANANYVADARKLVVRNTQSNLDIVTQIVETVIPQYEVSDEAKAARKKKTLMQQKLDEIIIPKVELKETSLAETVAFLNKQVAEYNAKDTDKERRDIKIEIVSYESTPAGNLTPLPASPDVMDQKLTLTLSDIPLGVAFDYVAKLANMRIEVEPYAVDVLPIHGTPDLVSVKVYKVPPDYPPPFPNSNAVNPGKNNAAAREQKMTAREHLEMAGVQFPPGGSAAFLPGPALLVVRNTQANLDLVEEILKSEEEYRKDQARLEKIREETLRISQVKHGNAVFPVLVSFQLRVKGNWVGIVDSDGSVYSGEISQPALQKAIARFNNRDFSNNAVGNNYHYDPAKAADSPLAFRVTGTNLTLSIPVVFEATFVPGVYEPNASDEGAFGAALRDKIAFGQMVNTCIRGRVQVGNKTIDIDSGPIP